MIIKNALIVSRPYETLCVINPFTLSLKNGGKSFRIILTGKSLPNRRLSAKVILSVKWAQMLAKIINREIIPSATGGLISLAGSIIAAGFDPISKKLVFLKHGKEDCDRIRVEIPLDPPTKRAVLDSLSGIKAS